VRAGRALQKAVVRSTGAADRGLVQRSDLTGFNWADVPAVLVEAGFLSNPTEQRRLQTSAYRQRVALGLARGVAAFVSP
jgi:N-acetylmuramoyl-L-alanine amidase